jgi:ribosomal-protein-serine acetyltransferase
LEHPAEILTRGPVRLRRWRGEDVDLVHRVVVESLPHLRPWLKWAAAPYDRDAAADFLAQSQERWASGKAYGYAITEDGVVAGSCALMRPPLGGVLQLGYWLHPAHTGRGLATTASSLLIGQAASMPGITRVEIWHDMTNLASEAVPRRLGFAERGRQDTDVIWELKL